MFNAGLKHARCCQFAEEIQVRQQKGAVETLARM